MNYGFIYCMGNPCMPGVYKIGMTERAPAQRCAELSGSTSSPNPFHILCFGQVEEPRQVEAEIHAYLSAFRVSGSREFFRAEYSAIDHIIGEFSDAFAETAEGSEEKEKERLRSLFLAAKEVGDKVACLIECARMEGIRFWKDGDSLEHSGLLHMSSWIAGAVHVYRPELLKVASPKAVGKLISLAEQLAHEPGDGFEP